MQPIKILQSWLEANASAKRCLFSLQDLRALLPSLSKSAFKTLLSRAQHANYLDRICRGIYLYKKSLVQDGMLLFHIATLLRSNQFNYISLETVLSDAGIISQIPMNRITIMSSGRSNIITCNNIGTIEFIHTKRKPAEIMHDLTYDKNAQMWRANTDLAIRDMKITRRNLDLMKL